MDSFLPVSQSVISHRVQSLRLFLLLAFCAVFAACATVTPQTAADPANKEAAAYDSGDPLEGFNRAMFSFNDKFDRFLVKPVAQGYRAVVPEFARQGVANFFSNLYEPINVVNNLLQGKFQESASDLCRFVANSTIGLFGVFDVGTRAGLEKHDEDFGQTFAVWGMGEGPYLVLPILGPSNVRDGLGEIPGWYFYPTQYMEEQSTANKLWVMRLINRRSQLLDASDVLDQAAGTGEDSYVFVREAYRQRRLNLIHDGNPPETQPDPSLFEDDPVPAGKK